MSCSLWWFRRSADAPLLYFLPEQSGEPAIIVFSRTWRQLQSPKLACTGVLRRKSCFFGMNSIEACQLAIGA
jgi:hypothetical protein